MEETPENRLKRLRLRSWRRGTKEMDLILGRFADVELHQLDPEALASYERLIAEEDQSLYAWFSRREPAPPEHVQALEMIRHFHNLP
ncbi:succinate dehydrogenase assembly factor 2 [Algicella marina]|uniref:FAD assembly factor SdhE n=1 Tax=Algicella marina TaxID=2683284 RepID=A0A6P1T676_9RHOB|nr:succinate dehydrogenase assembly factor 2 [Algicella marina]QHQ37311.1 succinate dehydrogenase assembly factor 2 [Algicella marina]